jgi:hypothetical protein
MFPRFTVSGNKMSFWPVGAAGLSFDTPSVIAPTTTTRTTA